MSRAIVDLCIAHTRSVRPRSARWCHPAPRALIDMKTRMRLLMRVCVCVNIHIKMRDRRGRLPQLTYVRAHHILETTLVYCV